MLYLKDVKINASTAELKFSLPLSAQGYLMSVDASSLSTLKPQNKELSVTLTNGIHLYTFMPIKSGDLPIKVQIDHSDNANEFIYCNLPGPNIEVSESTTWNPTPEIFSKEERDSAVNILKTHTAVFSKTTAFDKVIELSKFVASLPNNHKGIPQGKLSEFRPLKQLQESMKCNADIACGNYTAIYYYLAVNAGIKTRTITFRGGESTWSYGIHYYNEVFLTEQQQWTLADPLYNIYFPHDSSGRFSNAADVKKMTDVNGFSGKYVYSFKKDSTGIMPYESVKAGHVYYHSSNADMCFLHPGAEMNPSSLKTLLDFYSFGSDYSYYSDARSNDWGKIIVKYIAAILLLITIALYLLFELSVRRKR